MKKPVGVLLALAVVHLTALSGFAQMYRWTDSHGESYLTNDPDQVPDRYRKSVVILGTTWGAPPRKGSAVGSIVRVTFPALPLNQVKKQRRRRRKPSR